MLGLQDKCISGMLLTGIFFQCRRLWEKRRFLEKGVAEGWVRKVQQKGTLVEQVVHSRRRVS